jgi:hypothetical protein
MSPDNRYTEYLRAEERVMRAQAHALRLSPHYNESNEQRRANLIASYEDMADEYARMAASHEQEVA